MLIDFDALETTEMPNFKGGEGALLAKAHVDQLNKIMRCTLPLGSTVGLHTHSDGSEVILVLSGEADHIVDGQVEHLAPGLCGYCPKGSSHTLVTTSQEDLAFYAVVPQQ